LGWEWFSLDKTDSSGPSWLYTTKTIQSLLLDKYGDHVYVATVKGHSSVVRFCNHILSDIWKESLVTENATAAEKMVKQAAHLFAAELREIDTNTTVQDLSLQSCKTVISLLLKLLIQQLVEGELKQVALAQAVMQVAQPRTNILPL